MTALEFARYRFVLQPLETLSLPAYKGATFRGGFGHVFRRVACACGEGATIHQPHCLYARVFETPQDETLPSLPHTARMPHPFVLEPPLDTRRVYTPEDRLVVHLVLIGQALEWLPYFVFTFEELGRVGIGQRRGRYRLEEVSSLKEALTTPVFSGTTRRFLGPGQRTTFAELWQPDATVEAVDVKFLTCARVVQQGHMQVAVAFPLLFGALLRRTALLMYAHGGGGTLPLTAGRAVDVLAVVRYFFARMEQQAAERQAIRDAFGMAEQVTMTSHSLRWEDWERYSTRQDTHMKLGGVVGSVRYHGPLGAFLPYLRLGEYIHVGKNTVFGLGQMVVQVAEPAVA